MNEFKNLKTLKDLRIKENLCHRLDTDLYLPVKKELRGIGRTHSLGFKKENFKGTIETELEKVRQNAIEWIKDIIHKVKEGGIYCDESHDVNFYEDGELYFDACTYGEENNCYAHLSASTECQILMKIFNITKEDLE